MLIKLAASAKLPLINIVRREEQVQLLKEKYGAQYVLNSSTETFFEDFKNLAKELKATACIECVGGDLTGKLMDNLPSRSTVLFYGALSEKGPSEIDPLLLIGRSTKLEAFILGSFFAKKGLKIIFTLRKVNNMLADRTLASDIACKFPIS